MPDKPESKYTLEDWVAHHTTHCKCAGSYKCAGCVIRELEESWRKTLATERSSYLSLNRRYAALKDKLNATINNPSECA